MHDGKNNINMADKQVYMQISKKKMQPYYCAIVITYFYCSGDHYYFYASASLSTHTDIITPNN